MTNSDYNKSIEKLINSVKQSNDYELIKKYNREILIPSGVSARMSYLGAIHDEFDKRKFDYSSIGNEKKLSFGNIIELVHIDGKKIIQIIENNDKILNIFKYLRKNNLNSIYLLSPTKNNPLSELLKNLKYFFDIKGINVIKFDEKNYNIDIPLLTYGSPYGSPINEPNKKYPNIAIVIPFSLHSHIIGNIYYYSLENGIYINKIEKLNIIKKDNFKLVFIYKGVYGNDTAGYGVYLINSSDDEYKVHYETDGFITVDDEVHKLKGSKLDLENLKANSRILIEENDIGALDMSGFVHLTLTGKSSFKIDFDIGKGAPNGENIILEGFKEKGIKMDYNIKLLD